jgi:hypothetical protein
MLVPVVSDHLGLCASRTANRLLRHPVGGSLCWLVVVLAGRCRHCGVQGRAAAAATEDIERVSLARALDLAPEPDRDYDLMDQLACAEPPEIHWP